MLKEDDVMSLTHDKQIKLIITCESHLFDTLFARSLSAREKENASKEIIRFTKVVETKFLPQCGLSFTEDDEKFTLHGKANKNSEFIPFYGSIQHQYIESRITYLRQKRKEWRKHYLALGWTMEVIKEPESRYV